MANPKVIGSRLRKLREQRKLDDVAKAVGISVSALAMYESGKRVPRDEIKVRLASFYGESIESIFYAD